MFYLSYKPLMSPVIRAQINELLSELIHHVYASASGHSPDLYQGLARHHLGCSPEGHQLRGAYVAEEPYLVGRLYQRRPG